MRRRKKKTGPTWKEADHLRRMKRRHELAVERRKKKSPPKSAASQRFQSYAEYLKTEHWQRIRRMAIKHYGRACQVCRTTTKPINVHHLHYGSVGCESVDDLQVLCEDCHKATHGLTG